MINRKKLYKNLLVLGVFFLALSYFRAQGDPNKGLTLFKANCTACHTLEKELIGPPLKGIVEKLKEEKGLGTDWLHKWIKDNKSLRDSGDKYANEIFKKYNNTEMQVFPNLSDSDVDDILAYTSNPPVEAPKKDLAKEQDALALIAAQKAAEGNAKIIMISLSIVTVLLIWILLKIRQLVNITRSEEMSQLNAARAKSLAELYEKYSSFGKAFILLLAIFASYGVWNWMMWIGVYKGYKPEQPIYFSHKIHAGINKIDCRLCHSGAKYGKVSEIPSVNVCMNCHKSISEYQGDYLEFGKDRDFYNAEINKLYQAAGWDPSTMKYTGKEKPIQWVRIHNMQDFVYFSHAQHAVVGEKAIINSHNKKYPNEQIDVVCKACHGKIDTMNVVQMANDFTMGWCIECHRTTEIDMENAYNKEYFDKLHEKLKKQYGNGTKITVDAIGGIECGKCHY